jgi:hypothetical protein
MTNPERAMRRQQERDARKAARAAARRQGCACHVEAVVLGWVAGIPEVQVRHDDWCPLLRVMQEREPGARSQIVITPKDGES